MIGTSLKLKAVAELELRRRKSGARMPTFRGDNLAVQSYRGNEWILSGPAETGKTWATLWVLDSLLRETPKAKASLVRKLQVSMWGTVLVTWKRIQELRKAMGDAPAVAYGGEKPEWYTYENGAQLFIGGMDNPQKILSGERDFICVNQAEELSENDWETMLTRATGRGAQTKTPMLFGDCNPGPERHWILKRESLQVFYSKHVDNPSLYDESGTETEQGTRTMRILKSLTGVRKSRLYHGLWVGAEGLYFENWDEELHTCDPFDIPRDWPIWDSLDWGYAHPTAYGLFTTHQNTIYMIGEHVKNKWLVQQHCLAIQRLRQRLGIDERRIKRTVAGHDVFAKRGDSQGLTLAQQFAQAKSPETELPIGIKLEHATLDRAAGWQEIARRLGNAELEIGPTLQIFKTCPKTITGITRLVTDPNDPEDVLKVDADANGEGGDDEGDMLRYAVMEYHKLFKPRRDIRSTSYLQYS